MTLYHCNRGRNSAGFVVLNGHVIEAAPILRLQLGCTEEHARYWTKKKGWKITRDEEEKP